MTAMKQQLVEGEKRLETKTPQCYPECRRCLLGEKLNGFRGRLRRGFDPTLISDAPCFSPFDETCTKFDKVQSRTVVLPRTNLPYEVFFSRSRSLLDDRRVSLRFVLCDPFASLRSRPNSPTHKRKKDIPLYSDDILI